jgi:Na+-driven multidrug efflux pump
VIAACGFAALHCEECVLLLQVALGLGTALVWACIALLLVARHNMGQLFTDDVWVLQLVALTIPAMALSLLCECRTSACWHAAHRGSDRTAAACRMKCALI